jgi:hypothetical protein
MYMLLHSWTLLEIVVHVKTVGVVPRATDKCSLPLMRNSRLRLLVKLYSVVFGGANGFPKECTIHLFGEHLHNIDFPVTYATG